MCAYRMADVAYRADQHARLDEPHVAPLTALCRELSDPGGRGRVPCVAPIYGGVDARVLSLLTAPGGGAGPSGMLSIENEDRAAERMGGLLADAGIPTAELLPWNAYPWTGRDAADLTAADLDAGIAPLRRVLALAPRLGAVVLHGGTPQRFWERLRRVLPRDAGRLRAFRTFSTADRAFIGPPGVREERMADLRDTLSEVATMLRAADALS